MQRLLKSLTTGVIAILCLPPLLWQLLIAILLILAGTLLKNKELVRYGFNVALAVDRLANADIRGSDRETISSRTGRAIHTGRAKGYIKVWRHVLDRGASALGDAPEHSLRSIESFDFKQFEDDEFWPWQWPEGGAKPDGWLTQVLVRWLEPK